MVPGKILAGLAAGRVSMWVRAKFSATWTVLSVDPSLTRMISHPRRGSPCFPVACNVPLLLLLLRVPWCPYCSSKYSTASSNMLPMRSISLYAGMTRLIKHSASVIWKDSSSEICPRFAISLSATWLSYQHGSSCGCETRPSAVTVM
jgi:hypothetical protein